MSVLYNLYIYKNNKLKVNRMSFILEYIKFSCLVNQNIQWKAF